MAQLGSTAADSSIPLRTEHRMGLMSPPDVHFLVLEGNKQELFKAHKTILRAASDVFDAMFRFDAENAKAKSKNATCTELISTRPVVITDVAPSAFKAMLHFLYGDDDLQGVNGDNAVGVLYAAKKYNIAGLSKACSKFPVSKLRHVFLAFADARFLEENVFARRCLAYIDQNADTLLQSADDFLQIDQHLLCEILDRDQLVIGEEMTIWHAALRWADEQCRRNGECCTAWKRRVTLGPALLKIRFPLIPKEAFSAQIVPSGVLTREEVISVLLSHSHPTGDGARRSASDQQQQQLYPLRFATKRRSHRSTGRIVLNIEQFAEFARRTDQCRRYSDTVFVRGLPWRIFASRMRTQSGAMGRHLSLHLQCNNNNNNEQQQKIADYRWSCICSTTFRIVAQKDGKEDYVRERSVVFNNARSKGWGFSSFMPFEQIMHPDNGWYSRETDMLILAVDVYANEPSEEEDE